MLVLASAIGLVLAATGGTELPLLDKDRAGWVKLARDFGINCPVVSHLYDHGEDAAGKLYRISCESIDGKSKWDIRAVIPTGRRSYMAPW